jgi:two-component system LytT family sensor kinase
MKKSVLITIHLFFWLVFCFNYQYFYSNEGIVFNTISTYLFLSFLTVNLVTFYIHYWVVLPYFFNPKKIEIIFILMLISFLFFGLLRYSIEEIIYPRLLNFSNYKKDTSITYYLFDNLYYGANSILTSSLIWILNYSLKTTNEANTLRLEKTNAEISFLKSQINPHFIFNTLNNIYSLVYSKSNQSLVAIESLSKLLRYINHTSSQMNIEILKEWEYIENYIELESIRLNEPLNIVIHKNVSQDIFIQPMLLIPFIENAFKHGELSDKEIPFSIFLEADSNNIKFSVSNKISKYLKDDSTGIGIENIKKRLQITYPNKYKLKIAPTENVFSIELELEL